MGGGGGGAFVSNAEAVNARSLITRKETCHIHDWISWSSEGSDARYFQIEPCPIAIFEKLLQTCTSL